jgi:hypothetical protein
MRLSGRSLVFGAAVALMAAAFAMTGPLSSIGQEASASDRPHRSGQGFLVPAVPRVARRVALAGSQVRPRDAPSAGVRFVPHPDRSRGGEHLLAADGDVLRVPRSRARRPGRCRHRLVRLLSHAGVRAPSGVARRGVGRKAACGCCRPRRHQRLSALPRSRRGVRLVPRRARHRHSAGAPDLRALGPDAGCATGSDCRPNGSRRNGTVHLLSPDDRP